MAQRTTQSDVLNAITSLHNKVDGVISSVSDVKTDVALACQQMEAIAKQTSDHKTIIDGLVKSRNIAYGVILMIGGIFGLLAKQVISLIHIGKI